MRYLRHRHSAPVAFLAAAIYIMLLAPFGAMAGPAFPLLAELLLDAPLNATWAANNPELFAERGIQGLVLHTRLSGIPSPDAQAIPLQESLRFEEELRTALRRLGEAGVAANFLHLALAPEANYFGSREYTVAALAHLRQCARLAKDLGLRGVYLDARSTSLFYDLRWDGYPESARNREKLHAAAQDFGARAVRALIGEFPNIEIILHADTLEQSGSLFFPFAKGFKEGVGAAETVRLFLSLPLGPPAKMGLLQERSAMYKRQVDLRVRENYDTASIPQQTISWQIEPLRNEAGKSVLAMPLSELTAYIASVKTISDGYAILRAKDAAWWQISESDAAQFGHLVQGGEGAVAATGQVHPQLAALSWNTPLDGAEIVAEYETFEQGVASVYLKEGNATLAFWNGTTDRIRVEQRDRLIKLTPFDTLKEEYLRPRFGRLLVPSAGEPFMVDGLSIRDWAVPAAVRFTLDAALQETQSQVNGIASIANPFDISLEAQLGFVAPGYASFGGSTLPVLVAPKEHKAYVRLLQGRWTVRDKPELGLNLLFPASNNLLRTAPYRVYPELRWQQVMDSASVGAPLLHHWVDEESSSILLGGERGELFCIALDGTLQWTRQNPVGMANAPVAAAGPSALIYSMDPRGEITGHDARGNVQFAHRLPASPLKNTLHYAASLDFQLGDLLLATLSDGRLHCSAPHSGENWDYYFAGDRCYVVTGLQQANQPYDLFSERISRLLFVADGKDDGLLTGFDFENGLQWQRELDGPPTCLPLLVRAPGETRHRIITASAEGRIELWQAETAEKLESVSTGSRMPILQLAFGDVHENSGHEIFAVDESGVHCFSGSLRKLWHSALPAARQLVLVPGKSRTQWIAADLKGVLHGGDRNGDIIWRDDRALGALSGAPLIVPIPYSKGFMCVSAGWDGTVRAITVPD